MYLESLGKPSKQNTVRNLEKLVKEESGKDIDSKISGISTISGKQNTVKGIESNKKNHHLEVHDSLKVAFACFWYMYFSRQC